MASAIAGVAMKALPLIAAYGPQMWGAAKGAGGWMRHKWRGWRGTPDLGTNSLTGKEISPYTGPKEGITGKVASTLHNNGSSWGNAAGSLAGAAFGQQEMGAKIGAGIGSLFSVPKGEMTKTLHSTAAAAFGDGKNIDWGQVYHTAAPIVKWGYNAAKNWWNNRKQQATSSATSISHSGGPASNVYNGGHSATVSSATVHSNGRRARMRHQ
jgi:hypothetical protein